MVSSNVVGVNDTSLSTKNNTMKLTEYIYHGLDRPRVNGRFVKLREVD